MEITFPFSVRFFFFVCMCCILLYAFFICGKIENFFISSVDLLNIKENFTCIHLLIHPTQTHIGIALLWWTCLNNNAEQGESKIHNEKKNSYQLSHKINENYKGLWNKLCYTKTERENKKGLILMCVRTWNKKWL